MTEEEQQQAVREVYEYAAHLMVQEKQPDYAVKRVLQERGLDRESAELVVANIRERIVQEKKKGGQRNMLYGALWCAGGLVASFSDIGLVFWGAIVVGAAQLVMGLVQYTNSE